MAAARSPITTHVLNTSTGTPGAGLDIELYKLDNITRQFNIISSG